MQEQRRRAAVLLAEIGGPSLLMVVMLVAIEIVLRSQPVIAVIDANRPPYGKISTRLHVEKQLWHLEAVTRGPAAAGRVVFLGSSSVVNGIDETIATSALRDAGINFEVRNFGLTGLMGNELPSVAKYALAERTAAVVYLYNGFSFGEAFNPDALDTRWDTVEMVRLVPPTPLDLANDAEIVDRFFSEHIWLLKYRNLLLDSVGRWMNGEWRPLAHPFDYDPARPVAQNRPRTFAPPVSEADWVRRAYLESGRLDQSLGLAGLRRFCQLVRDKGLPLIITAAPEPVFGRYEGYAQGVDYGAIDKRVDALAVRCGATFLPRHSELEERDQWFVDSVHLGTAGREFFSALIASEVAPHLR